MPKRSKFVERSGTMEPRTAVKLTAQKRFSAHIKRKKQLETGANETRENRVKLEDEHSRALASIGRLEMRCRKLMGLIPEMKAKEEHAQRLLDACTLGGKSYKLLRLEREMENLRASIAMDERAAK